MLDIKICVNKIRVLRAYSWRVTLSVNGDKCGSSKLFGQSTQFSGPRYENNLLIRLFDHHNFTFSHELRPHWMLNLYMDGCLFVTFSHLFFWSQGRHFAFQTLIPRASADTSVDVLVYQKFDILSASKDRQYDGSSTVNIYSSSPKKRLIIDAALHLLNPRQKANSYTIYSICKRSTSRGSPIKLSWWMKTSGPAFPNLLHKTESIWRGKRNISHEFCLRIL